MSLNFDESYFTTKDEGMKGYRNFPHFKERALWVQANLSGSILEVGCAFGFLIYELDKLGVSIYGVDKSEYAGTQLAPEIANRVSIVDVMDMMIGQDHYDWIISWNLLDCLDDDEHAKNVSYTLNMGGSQLHVVCMSGQRYTDQGYFIRDYNYWRNLFPDAYLVDHETRTMYVPDGKELLSEVPLVKNLVSD